MTTEEPMLEALVERARPLIECEHRANRPNERVSGERIVGFVIDQDDIGLGLSEPLAALGALVDLARIASTTASRTPPVDQDEVERAARALCKACGRDPDAMLNEVPEWVYRQTEASFVLASIGSGAGDVREALDRCSIPPEGWWCSRKAGHEGPCAARPCGASHDK